MDPLEVYQEIRFLLSYVNAELDLAELERVIFSGGGVNGVLDDLPKIIKDPPAAEMARRLVMFLRAKLAHAAAPPARTAAAAYAAGLNGLRSAALVEAGAPEQVPPQCDGGGGV